MASWWKTLIDPVGIMGLNQGSQTGASNAQVQAALQRNQDYRDLFTAQHDFARDPSLAQGTATVNSQNAGTYADTPAFYKSLNAEAQAETPALETQDLGRINALRARLGLPQNTMQQQQQGNSVPFTQVGVPGQGHTSPLGNTLNLLGNVAGVSIPGVSGSVLPNGVGNMFGNMLNASNAAGKAGLQGALGAGQLGANVGQQAAINPFVYG